MKHLRVVSPTGSQADYEAEFVPRVGELIQLDFGTGSEPARPHYYRVKDVMYRLDNSIDHQVAILIEEVEAGSNRWPG